MRTILVILLLAVIYCHAQTNVIWGYLGDYTLNPLPGNVQITLVDPNPRNINGILVSPLYPPINFGTNGTFSVTNLPFGTYRTLFDSGLTFPFYVLTNTFGSNNIANLGTFASVTPPPYIILNSSATVFITLTNGPGITFTNISTNIINGYTNILTMVRTN